MREAIKDIQRDTHKSFADNQRRGMLRKNVLATEKCTGNVVV